MEKAVSRHVPVKTAVFHEGLTLVQRDRNAAWFAEEDGAAVAELWRKSTELVACVGLCNRLGSLWDRVAREHRDAVS